MMKIKCKIDDRDYTSYTFYNSDTSEELDNIKINPINYKLFNQDIFELTNDNMVSIIHSPIRCMNNIPGVLVLENNKTFGKRKNKFYYKCIPDDIRLPIFIVAYKPKINFNKIHHNKYVIFNYKNWTGKHPTATIENSLGDINKLENFYDYQLYCKSLYTSIQNFTKNTKKLLRKTSENEYIKIIDKKYKPEDRTSMNIFSIDPENCVDIDDAFGYEVLENSNIKFSIYIANVSLWMDAIGIWDSFSTRISTIYLPDRKRTMLPKVLSDSLCSLHEKLIRFAFTIDIEICSKTSKIIDYSYFNTKIKVNKNFVYESQELLNTHDYKFSNELIQKLNKNYSYLDNINDSHDFIAYIMILMNYLTAKKLSSEEVGIFRSVKSGNINNTSDNTDKISIPKDISKFLKMWNSSGGNYTKYKNLESHDILNFEAYVHVTSPIRRIVDLLNIIIYQKKFNVCELSESCHNFLTNWTTDESLDYINTTVRSIRKVQNDCNLLKICIEDRSVINKIYNGYIFDKLVRDDNTFKYTVYIPFLKMVNRFISNEDRPNISNEKFKIYLFLDENTLRNKIRIEIV